MFFECPRQCITMYCTLGFDAITLAIFSSASPPLTSLIYVAPTLIACLATSARIVSTLTTAPSFTNSLMTGITLFNSSSSLTLSAPGLVDSPPTSIMSAPSTTKRRPPNTASSLDKCLPPSANESGVIFSIPITTVRLIITCFG